jgi:sulfate-transporting ATPase
VHQEGIPEVPDGEAFRDTGKRLEIRDLEVRFGGIKAVDGVTFDVEPGQIVGLIGPNGAGKTTVIEAITGFAPLHAGSVAVDGRRIDRMTAHARARQGVIRSFQSLELFADMTVADNLRVAADDRSWRRYVTDLVFPGRTKLSPAAAAAIHEFELTERLDALPADLPFGEQRLVAIARAVAARPAALLLDEPAAGLGDAETQELGRLLTRLARNWGVAILLVEHDVDLVMSVCDKVVAIEFGRQLAYGTPEEMRTHPEVLRAYLGTEEGETDRTDETAQRVG